MAGQIQSLWRHPVKGFTPERLASAALVEGGFFPCDRIYAVEDGPSGFNPTAPAFIRKQKFTVLAKIAAVAKARTVYDEASGALTVSARGYPDLTADLNQEAGREAFCAWLTAFLGPEAGGVLKIVSAPGHRFTDDPRGCVSIINLASVRDLERRLGRPIDPLRFRGNIYVEGWEPWAENDWVGRTLSLGPVTAQVFKPIMRCVATHVDPATGERDLDLVPALFEAYGHRDCGIYVAVTGAGTLAEGDAVRVAA